MKVWEPSFDVGMLSRGFQPHVILMPGQTVSQVQSARVRMADFERRVRASVPSSMMMPFWTRAGQVILLEERVDCTAVRSLLSTKLKRRALNELLLPQRVSEVPVLVARTNHEREGRSISFLRAYLASLSRHVRRWRGDVDDRWVVLVHVLMQFSCVMSLVTRKKGSSIYPDGV